MAKSYDPIAPVAEEISEEACLLCFDEFQVNIFLYFHPISLKGIILRNLMLLPIMCCSKALFFHLILGD